MRAGASAYEDYQKQFFLPEACEDFPDHVAYLLGSKVPTVFPVAFPSAQEFILTASKSSNPFQSFIVGVGKLRREIVSPNAAVTLPFSQDFSCMRPTP